MGARTLFEIHYDGQARKGTVVRDNRGIYQVVGVYNEGCDLERIGGESLNLPFSVVGQRMMDFECV